MEYGNKIEYTRKVHFLFQTILAHFNWKKKTFIFWSNFVNVLETDATSIRMGNENLFRINFKRK